MSDNWITAAQNYRTAEEATKLKEQERIISARNDQNRQDEEARRKAAEIDLGTTELEQFMRADGQSAMELLRASSRHINFGEERVGGGYGVVYLIDGNGLQQSVEGMGMWVAYSKDVREPKFTPITAREAVEAAVDYGGKKATEVVGWLRGELDKIATSAPANK